MHSPRSKQQMAFSQSLNNVRWRFLREDKHIQEQHVDLNVPIILPPSQRQRRRTTKKNPSLNNSSVFSAGSSVIRQSPPSVPSANDGRSTLDRVRDLQQELSNNDFPSKVFRFLSSDNNTSNDAIGRQQQQWGNSTVLSNRFDDSYQGDGGSVLPSGMTMGGGSSARESFNPQSSFSPDAIQREMERLSQAIDPSTSNTTMYRNKAMFNAATAEKHTRDNDDLRHTATNDDTHDTNEHRPASASSVSSGSSSESDDDRPVSPIIIWRPSARVQIADDLPPELLAELLGQPPPTNTASSSSSSSFSPPSNTNPRPFAQQSSSSPRGGASQSLKNGGSTVLAGKSKAKPFLNKDYGAWYLKPKQWNNMMTGSLQEDYNKTQNARISGSDAEIEKVINMKAKELNSVLPKLFISTVYREWLEKQEQEHPESSLPMPYYLKKKTMKKGGRK